MKMLQQEYITKTTFVSAFDIQTVCLYVYVSETAILTRFSSESCLWIPVAPVWIPVEAERGLISA